MSPVEEVLLGYTQGLFPMAEEEGGYSFYTAYPRAVLPLERFHCPSRLARRLKNRPFEMRRDSDFEGVIRGCAARDSTWISDEIVAIYRQLHRAGYVHTVEAWNEDGLVGGLYGVVLGGAFFGESMFHRASDASKACVVHLVEHLRQAGFRLLDCQQ
ncbi:MAG: leucyl/phenylalanyl-tRNA--protein transferase, partial [Candidatus Eremiobacteraeota bacterium]|nr:leucyl/phenylalanyl-tRNA--protein transferase [Candidatus Eremiobacteraeota bacterium]